MKKIILTEQQKQEIQNLYRQGKKDTEIALAMKLNRKTIGRYRREQDLPSYKDDEYVDIEQLKNLCELKYGIKKICKELNISEARLRKLVKDNNITLPFLFVITPEKEGEIIRLYNQGKTDIEISRITGVKSGTIFYFRKTHNLPTKFTYDKVSKINKTNFEELFKQGLSDYAIAKKIGMSPDGVYSHRMRHGFHRDSLSEAKNRPLTEYQKQVLMGIMLGDGWMGIGKNSKNPRVKIAHCVAQKEYSEHIANIFSNIGGKCFYRIKKTPDYRNNKCYESYDVEIPANPALIPFYEGFYLKGKKYIPFNLFDNFSEISLAFLFMDDGYKTSCSYSIATNCFNLEELEEFRIFLKRKFNLETSIFKNNVLYIRAKSRDIFTALVSPYVIPCMRYKLHV